MPRMWRNRIWGGQKTYEACVNNTPYSADVEAIMRQDVADGLHTAEEFEAKTGLVY